MARTNSAGSRSARKTRRTRPARRLSSTVRQNRSGSSPTPRARRWRLVASWCGRLGAVTGVTPSGTVVRFAVVASDGRRSSEWRVWTGDKKPSDEVYIAPRSGGDRAKISLHKDGYSQHGPTKPTREGLRPEDRRAFDRWFKRVEVLPGWRFGYVLGFADSELRDDQPALPADVVVIPAPPAEQLVLVTVFIVDAPAPAYPDLTPLRQLVYLERRGGGAVAVCVLDVPHEQAWVDDAYAILRAPASVWSLPQPFSREQDYAWAHGQAPDGTRRVLELAPRGTLKVRQGTLEDRFPGEVRPWDELPVPERPDLDMCAVLQVPPGATPILYVDDRARCDHAHLADDAAALLSSLQRGQLDAGWDRLPDGSYITGVLPMSAALRAGELVYPTKRPLSQQLLRLLKRRFDR